MLQIKYPPTMEIIVGNGPMLASVYCASPPVVFGISAFNSDKEATVVILRRQAIIIAPINTTPMVPAPCPSETRQLVAMTRPTDTDTTLLSPSFFSSIASTSFSNVKVHLNLHHRFLHGWHYQSCIQKSFHPRYAQCRVPALQALRFLEHLLSLQQD